MKKYLTYVYHQHHRIFRILIGFQGTINILPLLHLLIKIQFITLSAIKYLHVSGTFYHLPTEEDDLVVDDVQVHCVKFNGKWNCRGWEVAKHSFTITCRYTQNADHVNRQCLQWALLLPLQVNIKEMRVLLKRSWNAFFEEQSFAGSIHWSPLSWRHHHLRHKQQQCLLLPLLWCDTENNESYSRRGLLESIIITGQLLLLLVDG